MNFLILQTVLVILNLFFTDFREFSGPGMLEELVARTEKKRWPRKLVHTSI